MSETMVAASLVLVAFTALAACETVRGAGTQVCQSQAECEPGCTCAENAEAGKICMCPGPGNGTPDSAGGDDAANPGETEADAHETDDGGGSDSDAEPPLGDPKCVSSSHASSATACNAGTDYCDLQNLPQVTVPVPTHGAVNNSSTGGAAYLSVNASDCAVVASGDMMLRGIELFLLEDDVGPRVFGVGPVCDNYRFHSESGTACMVSTDDKPWWSANPAEHLEGSDTQLLADMKNADQSPVSCPGDEMVTGLRLLVDSGGAVRDIEIECHQIHFAGNKPVPSGNPSHHRAFGEAPGETGWKSWHRLDEGTVATGIQFWVAPVDTTLQLVKLMARQLNAVSQ